MSNTQSSNPWPGLGSYDESGQYKFCGRGKAANELYSLISNNAVISLFGRSGIGKTSLLKAGVMPLLVRKGFHPVYVRLSQEEKTPDEKGGGLSYAECVVRSLEKIMQEKGFGKNETEYGIVEPKSPDYLWSYFCRTEFQSKEDENVTPVIILDQFEEIFQDRREDAALLMRQIYALVNDSRRFPKSLDYAKFRNRFRFVMSFRDDSLYLLEDVINECNLATFKENRYLLKALDRECAKEVITKPREGLVDNEVADKIVEKIAKSGGESVDPAVLSLLMYGLYERMIQKEQMSIQSTLVDEAGDDIVQNFYEQGMSGIGLSARKHLEEQLVTSDGRRRSVAAADVSKYVKEEDLKILENCHILTKLQRGSFTDYELTHDVLCPIVMASHKETIAKEEIAKNKRKVRIMAAVVGIVVAIVIVFIVQNKHIREQQWIAQGNQSRYIAEKALELAEEGDVYLAKLLLLNTIPQNLDDPERPLTAESVSALAKIFDEEKGILRGHTSSVNSVAFSPDGKTIVSASSDKTIKIWDVATGKCLKTLPDQKEVGSWTSFRSVSYSPDGKTLVSASWDSIVKIWDVSTGKCMHVLEHADKVNSALYDPLDGKTIVTASWDNTVKIWDAKTENCLDTLKGHGNDATAVSYSPDGKSIVSASDDRTIRIWDAASGNCVKTIPVQKDSGHKGGIKSVAYSPDGKTIVSASVDSTVKIWNALTGECLKTLQGHVGPVLAASYGPDGKTIVSASVDHTIRIWDASTGNCLDTLIGHTSAVCSVVYSPDGKAIASASDEGTIRIWGVSTEEGSWKPLPSSTNLVGSSLGNHQGKIVVTNDGHSAKIWNASTGECLRTLASQHPINTASYSPDGKTIVTTYCRNIGTSYSPNVAFWNSSVGPLEKSFSDSINGKPTEVFSASYSPDGKTIAFALSDSLAIICDVLLKSPPRILIGHTDWVITASYSPDGKTIVTASHDSTARIWSVSTMKPICPPLKHKEQVYSAEYSHNGKTIVTSSSNTITLWTSTGKFLRNLTGPLWFGRVSFSPDDKNIIAYSGDGEIGIWDVASGCCLKTLKVPTPKGEKVVSASYSPDGKSIVVILSNGTVLTRKAPPSFQEMLEITRERFKNRALTPEEKHRYYLE